MSTFGGRVAYANKLIDAEFADGFDFLPMREVVNALPEPDPDRQGGRVRAILLQPGKVLGSGWGLNAMHERSTSEPTLFYMARGKLTDVRRFDRFLLHDKNHNPDIATGTKCYEVGDGPRPVGYGRYLATLVEIDPLQINPQPAPPEGEVIGETEIDLPW